jgi:hypothetical protein
MIKIMLFLFILAFIPVLFASDPPNDPFFDIFNVEKIFALEPTSITKAREDISKAKAFFEKELSGKKISQDLILQKNLFLEYHRIFIDGDFPISLIDLLISKAALSPLGDFLEAVYPDWLEQVNIVCDRTVKIRESISFLLTPPEYESLLGFLGDAKEEQKQAIFDKIQKAMDDSHDWNNNCCSSFAARSEIIKLKDKLVVRYKDNMDLLLNKWSKECALIFASLKSQIGGNLEEKEFEKVSIAFFCFLFFNILANLPQEDRYELLFYRLLERGGEFSPSNADVDFLTEIKKYLDNCKNPSTVTKVDFSNLVKSPELVKAGTTLVENAITAHKLSISKQPSNPDPKPLPQDPNPNSTYPGRGKIIAAICVIILFILAAVGAGLILYRRQRKI